MQNDFPAGVVNDVSHRPWALPERGWVMKQSWHDLLFAHWPLSVNELRELIPSRLDVDEFDGTAWLGVIPFHMTNVTPRAMPALPWVSAFPELNVRTYVTYAGKPGVFFFSLDAANPLAVVVARVLFHLPYYRAAMDVAADADGIRYQSRRTSGGSAVFNARYRPTGPTFNPKAGTLEYFLTERYCLYSADHSRRLRRVEIHHSPWSLQMAEALIEHNTMADASGIRLPAMTPLFHFAKRQDALTWAPSRV